MSLVINSVYEPMSEGLHGVTITNVEDLGLQETQFGMKECAAIYFMADDQDRTVDACMKVIQSLHPKSNLVKLLTVLSVPFGETFDLNVLVGVKCEVVIQHKEKDGQTYANIAAVLKIRKRAGPRLLAAVRRSSELSDGHSPNC